MSKKGKIQRMVYSGNIVAECRRAANARAERLKWTTENLKSVRDRHVLTCRALESEETRQQKHQKQRRNGQIGKWSQSGTVRRDGNNGGIHVQELTHRLRGWNPALTS